MAAEPRPGGFGSKLREARERQGITLRQIANETKISVRALEALERNDIARLPGGIFSRAFVRAYAGEVGLDPEETIQEFMLQFPQDSVTAGHPTTSQFEDREALESDRRMAATALRLLVISVPIAAVGLYVIAARPPAPTSPPTGTEATVGRAGPIPSAASRPSDESAAPPAAQLVGKDQQPTEPRPEAVGSGRLQVAVRLTGRSWVSAIVDGKREIAREMVAGEVHLMEAQRDVVLSVGNAGAVSVTLNGVSAKPLGRPGQVVTIQLNSTNFKNYLAP